MDSKGVFIPELYHKFKFEYFKSSLSWKEFIIAKDIGLITGESFFFYEIIDEKKWLLSKLKYGF